jgi:mannose-6-phosphate isomerase-like protein (cupin superfamily)
MSTHVPTRVPRESIRVYPDTEDGGFRVGVAVEAERQGSLLNFGVKWIQPGTEPVSWDADEQTHETYYVHRGTLQISWHGGEDGEAELGAGDCFYLAPGHSYRLENIGPDEVFAVWAARPGP